MRTVVFAMLLGAAFAASAQLYRWSDEKGRVHLTDTPPPTTAKNVKEKSYGGGESASGDAALPYALQVAAKNFPVTLFTAPDCAPCGAARSLLNARGVPFHEISVVDQRQSDQLKQAVGSLSVPSILVGSSVQKGFEENAYNAMLDNAGYPRAGILPPRRQAEPRPEPPKPAAASDETAEEPTAGPYKPR
jgi:glutaredoxin